MMFNKLAFKLLFKENARLRREIRERDARIKELIDTFVYHKAPERVAQVAEPYEHTSDALTKAYAEGMKEIDAGRDAEDLPS